MIQETTQSDYQYSIDLFLDPSDTNGNDIYSTFQRGMFLRSFKSLEAAIEFLNHIESFPRYYKND